jgi:phosphoglycolate phosphatase-like HAD superfamily hydrolase
MPLTSGASSREPVVSAFIFDLDRTLVDSASPDVWREARLRPRVRQGLDHVRAFAVASEIAPHEIPGRLKQLGYPVAIVTSSPRSCAEALLEAFGIAHDVLVAYEDTTEHTPHPAPLVLAAERLGVRAAAGCFVGSDPADVEASFRAGMLSIGAGWSMGPIGRMASAAADLLVYTPETLLQPQRLAQCGYLAEVTCANLEPLLHRGSILPCGGRYEQYALGRYFAREDPRHAGSALAERILELKSSDGGAGLFAAALRAFFRQVDWTADFLIPVPPKPDQPRNRFEALLGLARAGIPVDTTLALDGLRCVRQIDHYKSLGALDRSEAVSGAFEATAQRNGSVLLLDDVITTGETANECARTLVANGASEVRVVALARDQHPFAGKVCPLCERPMRVRMNRATGERFWGCSGGPSRCQHTERLDHS